jgi:hypothetical protein
MKDHCLTSTGLDPPDSVRTVHRIAGEVSQWLSRLFHFPGGLAHCHDGIREGLVRTVQMVLHHTYPDLQVISLADPDPNPCPNPKEPEGFLVESNRN